MSEIKDQVSNEDKLMKAAEIAESLNISRAFAYRLMQRGKIRTVNIQGARRVRFSDLQEYIRNSLSPEPAEIN